MRVFYRRKVRFHLINFLFKYFIVKDDFFFKNRFLLFVGLIGYN